MKRIKLIRMQIKLIWKDGNIWKIEIKFRNEYIRWHLFEISSTNKEMLKWQIVDYYRWALTLWFDEISISSWPTYRKPQIRSGLAYPVNLIMFARYLVGSILLERVIVGTCHIVSTTWFLRIQVGGKRLWSNSSVKLH